MSLLAPEKLAAMVTLQATAEWPTEPYKGLNYFQRTDAPLFGERDSDVRHCAAIVGSATNKVLLLHGRSGTGKSSFLRAGLLPELRRAHFYSFESAGNGDEPLLVRCTADPLRQLQHTLLLRLSDKECSAFLRQDGRDKKAISLLQDTTDDQTVLADRILDSLQTVSAGSTRPLLIIIDQGEEVFTLGSPAEVKSAFFYLIEELCIRHIDVKLIVSIRTEYYGQFCDELRIDPNLTVSTSKTSLDQYMLHGLRSEEQIVATIIRPTLAEPLGPYCPPREIYNFAFEEGVALEIAQDLLEHCGESSILPVMQIVCRDLFRSVVGNTRPSTCRMISLRDYDRLGRVDGRVNAFIESSIRDVLRSVANSTPTVSQLSKWQEVLANLVARQEGGVLASLLVDEDKIIQDAKERGVSGEVQQCLKEMATERSGLLRISEGAGAIQYSLGHDALAPSLFQWREARTEVLQERRAARRVKVALAITSGIIVLSMALVLWQVYQSRSQALRLIATLAENDNTPTYKNKLLLTLRAALDSSGVLSDQLSHEEHVLNLKQNLARAPVFVSKPGLAVGFRGDELVRLDRDGNVWVHKIDGKGESERLVGIVPRRATDDQTAVAIGYIEGLARPVIYQGGFIFWWPDNPGSDDLQRVELKSLLPPDFGASGFVWVEIAGGRIRATQSAGTPRIFSFVQISRSADKFIASDMRQLAWNGPFWPVYSPYSDQIAFLANREVKRTSRGDPGAIATVGPIAQSKPSREADEAAKSELFLESVGFARDDTAILVRPSRSDFLIFPKGSHEPLRLSTYPTRQEAATRPRFGFLRPLLTAVHIADSWRLAWVGEEGIDMLEGSNDGLGSVVRAKQLLPAAALDSIVRLEFSRDGRWLVAVSQSGFLDPVVFRYWDLSTTYLTQLYGMSLDQLKDRACATAAFEGSNKFSPAEVKNLFSGRDRQPCEGK